MVWQGCYISAPRYPKPLQRRLKGWGGIWKARNWNHVEASSHSYWHLDDMKHLGGSSLSDADFSQDSGQVPRGSWVFQKTQVESLWPFMTSPQQSELPLWLSDKESACNAGDLDLIPGSGRPPGEGNGKLKVAFLPGESHGQRSLGGCSPWGWKRVGHDWAANTVTFSSHRASLLPYSIEGRDQQIMAWC